MKLTNRITVWALLLSLFASLLPLNAPNKAYAEDGQIEVLQNLGFEEGTSSPLFWDPAIVDGHEGAFVWDTDDKHSGQRSAKLVKTNSAGLLTLWGNSRASVEPNKAYTVEGYQKIANASGGRTYILISQFNAAGARVAANSYLNSEVKSSNQEWEKITYNFTTEADTAFVSFALTVDSGAITAWYDDLALIKDVPVEQLQNLGFEDGTNSPLFWDPAIVDGHEGAFVWDTDDKHSGQRSAKLIKTNSAGLLTIWGNSRASVEPNKAYTVEAYQKIANASGGRTYILINQFNASGDRVAANSYLNSEVKSSNQEWEKITYNFTTEADTAYVSFALTVDTGAITAWYDDLLLKEYIPVVQEQLQNLGFEDGTNNPLFWDPAIVDGHEGAFVWDTDDKHSGQRSAKLVKTNSAGLLTLWGNSRASVEPNKAYTVEAYQKIANANGGRTYILVSQFNATGARVAANSYLNSEVKSSNQEWEKITYNFTTEADTAFVSFALTVDSGKITAWYDDLLLKEYIPVVQEQLQNLGFEDGTSSPLFWDPAIVDGHEGAFVWDTDDKHSGQRSAKLVKTNSAGLLTLWGNSRASVDPNKAYTVEAYQKIANASGGRTYILVSQFNEAGDRVAANSYLNSEVKSDNQEWKKMTYVFVTEADTAYVSLALVVDNGTITAWYDNIALSPALNLDFELVEGMKVHNWKLNNESGAAGIMLSDSNYYYSGEKSIRVERSGNKGDTSIVSGISIPVEPYHAYSFKVYVKSSSAWQSRAQLSVIESTTSGAKRTHQGIPMMLNEGDAASEWMLLEMRYIAQADATEVRLQLGVTPGNATVWFDHISFEYADRVAFQADFEEIAQSGLPDLWKPVLISGSPELFINNEGYEGGNSLAISHTNAGDRGQWSTPIDTLIPNKKYRVEGVYKTTLATEARMDLQFIDWTKIGIPGTEWSQILPATEQWQPFSFELTAPSAYQSTLNLGLNGARGRVEFDNLKIIELETPLVPGAWNGEWIWYPEDAYTVGQNSDRYFRQTITLTEVPKEGYIQITSDDSYDLYVNGTLVSQGWDWRRPQLVNITPNLTTGQNVIAVRVHNDASAAGLLYDGYIIEQDGTFIQVKSDQQHVVSAKNVTEGWTVAGYDDSEWLVPMTYGRPPARNMPWGDVPTLITSDPRYALWLEQYEIPEVLMGGENNLIRVTYRTEQLINEDLSLTIHLMNGSTRVWSQKLPANSCGSFGSTLDWPINENIEQCYSVYVPEYVPEGSYELQFAPENLYFMNEEIPGTNTVAEVDIQQNETIPVTTSSVSEYKGNPTLFIDGVPQSTMMFSPPVQRGAFSSDSVNRYGEEGVDQVAIWITLEEIWERDGSLNFINMDAKVVDVLSSNPNANIMMKVLLDPPLWWEAEYPDERQTFQSGDQSRYSFASIEWREQAGEAFEQIIDYVNKAAYTNHIFGYQLMAGRTMEWMWWDVSPMPVPGATLDFSPAALNQFRAWLVRRYDHNVNALQAAWNNSSVTFANATVPELASRTNSEYQILLNPETQRNVIDYHTFLADMVADSIMYFSSIVKEKTDRRLVVGAYYGYVWNFYSSDANGSSHMGLSRLLNSSDIDFFAGPISYDERSFGDATTAMTMVDSIKLNGKMYVTELDNRTWLARETNPDFDHVVGLTKTVRDSVEQLKRDYSYNLIKGTGLWWFDMDGGWFADEQLYTLLGTMKEEMDHSIELPTQSSSDVAVYVNENFYTNLSVDFGKTYSVMHPLLNKQRHNLATMGAPFDTYLISDLVKGNVPDYKINIMLSPFGLTEEERAAIDSELKKDGKMIVWIYLPGISDGNSLDVTHMESLTGFDMVLENRLSDLDVAIQDSGHALTEGLSTLTYGALNSAGSGGKTGPIVYVEDSEAMTLGILTDNNQTGLALKDMGTWKSLYSSAPNLPNGLLENILSYMNTEAYTESGSNVLFANDHYVMIYSMYGGEKTIHLPAAAKVYDVFGKAQLSSNTTEIHFTLADGETKLFRLEALDTVVPIDPSNPTGPNTAADLKSKTVSPGDLKSDEQGTVVVELSTEQEEVLLPQETIRLIIEKGLSLEIHQGDAQVTLPTGWLKALWNQEQSEGGLTSLRIRITAADQEESQRALSAVSTAQNANIRLVGRAWDISLILNVNGIERVVSQFPQALKLSLPAGEDIDRKISGIFHLEGNGKITFVGGRLVGDRIETELAHLSQYALLAYDKKFNDVLSTHWAAEAIRQLAARQIVNGVTTTQFAPDRSITRAEFTALLARAIGIEEVQASTFTDVKPGAWYAGIVNGAAAKGLIQGVASDKFAPDSVITREQMAVLLIRAYEWKTGESTPSDSRVKFVDEANVSGWAKDKVSAAASLSLMIGRSNAVFVPQGTATRAESAKAIYNLLSKASLLQ